MEKTDCINKSALNSRKAAQEYQSYAWPGDSKGAHETLDCYRWKRMENGTASFPKAKESQMLKIEPYKWEQDLGINLYITFDETKEQSDI